MSNRQPSLELWGGVECTINRVGDRFFDQLDRLGHRDRAEQDLQRFADLGIKALRTGLQWERFEATGSWADFDDMLSIMDRLQIRPIAGLLHHGSGPPSTNLLDPEFPEKLAAYALQVAQRYPHILDYTPVNEPQTTGRFACLYGHWYPHDKSMQSYVRALYHQIKGVALSMQAIRSVQPAARLIHTEDGGAIFSTPQLEGYRQDREHRRWLGTDLLCGCVTRRHPLFSFLLEHGLSETEILWFVENPCPPSVLGLNYYVTSDRFLDHRVELYPGLAGGDTQNEPLVDFEAVRVRPEGILGVGNMLRQAWDRYHLPMAITEAHLGCEPVEQTRWLAEVWQETEKVRQAGVDVRAVTVWALLGSFDWCHLCTWPAGDYEPGIFDISKGTPEPTALSALAYRLGHGLPPGRAATERGWWHHPDRLTIPSFVKTSEDLVMPMSS
ncbi:MAG: dTDP-4-dehydrorhamnose reductase, partial [Janthinobacterium lividum]